MPPHREQLSEMADACGAQIVPILMHYDGHLLSIIEIHKWEYKYNSLQNKGPLQW